MFNDTFKILLIEANNYLKICWSQSTIVRNIVVSIQQKHSRSLRYGRNESIIFFSQFALQCLGELAAILAALLYGSLVRYPLDADAVVDKLEATTCKQAT